MFGTLKKQLMQIGDGCSLLVVSGEGATAVLAINQNQFRARSNTSTNHSHLTSFSGAANLRLLSGQSMMMREKTDV